MAAIYILSGYQNYFNRQIKEPKELVAAYPQNLVSYYDRDIINFNPADGVITSHVLGRQSNPYDGSGDYFLYSQDGVNVTSRWFIIESLRNAYGQYKLTLKKDVIADNYQDVLTADIFVEKATVDDDNPLIYNQEPITTNQIKTSETPLMDESKMAWIVGFVNRDAEARTLSINSTVVPDIKVNSLDDWDYYKYIGSGVASGQTPGIRAYVTRNTPPDVAAIPERWGFYSTKMGVKVEDALTASYIYENYQSYMKTYLNGYRTAVRGKVTNQYKNYFTNLPIQNETDFYGIQSQQGKIIQVGTNTFYKVTLDRTEKYSQEVTVTEDKSGGDLYSYMENIFDNAPGRKSGTGSPIYKMSLSLTLIKPVLTPVVEGEYTIEYPAKTSHLINKDAPFDIFCIPYSDNMSIQVGSSIISANKQFAMSIASEIGRTLVDDCYDIQLLPYCPMTGYTVTEKLFDINSTDSKRYTAVKKGTETVYWIFWSTSNSGTFNIELPLSTSNKKISNQCDMYRLVSPNYSGQFEFNLAKNGGSVDSFNVDYTYLPVSSYIHVNPDFKELYGKDYNDARGLICQGDFSVMYLKSAWLSYQQQNKNYEQVFSREISNMDVNRKYQRIGETISAWTGAIGAGGGIGGLIGGVAGAIGGTIAGGASLAAGYADRAISDKLYQESVSFKKDMHEMQLENIKALPNSIAKTTAYTENNKIFPILEYYTCTDEEKDLVAKAIANMGMTVNAVGKLQDYIDNSWSYGSTEDRGFFKGSLIKLENLPEDYHMLQTIAEELSLGIYIKGE